MSGKNFRPSLQGGVFAWFTQGRRACGHMMWSGHLMTTLLALLGLQLVIWKWLNKTEEQVHNTSCGRTIRRGRKQHVMVEKSETKSLLKTTCSTSDGAAPLDEGQDSKYNESDCHITTSSSRRSFIIKFFCCVVIFLAFALLVIDFLYLVERRFHYSADLIVAVVVTVLFFHNPVVGGVCDAMGRFLEDMLFKGVLERPCCCLETKDEEENQK